MKDIPVPLAWFELQMSTFIGCQRQIQNMFKNRENAYGATDDVGWQLNIQGAIGEQVVAKYRNVYWNGNIGDLKAADVGRLQARLTIRPNGRLVLHPWVDGRGDKDEDTFILVTGVGPMFTIRGWIYGHEGKRKEYWCDPTGKGRFAYFVPQSVLHPLDELVDA